MPKPVAQAIYLSTTYERNPDGSYEDGYIYSRADNPNRRTLEKQLAKLEVGAVAFAFSSGMAAVQAMFLSLKTGDHVLIPDDVYFNVRLLLDEVFADWGLTYTVVDMSDTAAIQAARKPTTKLIWLETPSNPQLKLSDIKVICSLAESIGAKVAVDNTWPTPIHQLPFELGADFIIHSSTKYFGGHSDVLGGVLIAREESVATKKIGRIQHVGGAVPNPMDCYLISRGLQTLDLRVRKQSESAAVLAKFLEEHPEVEKVRYPGLKSHPQHTLALEQMKDGFGGMLSVLIKGDAARTVHVANELKYFTLATSLGGVESLIEHRKSVEGPDSSTPDNLLRLSIGIEPVETLINDWEHALKR